MSMRLFLLEKYNLTPQQEAQLTDFLIRLQNDKQEILLIYGPSGVGKTALALDISQRFPLPVLDDWSKNRTLPKKSLHGLPKPDCLFYPERSASDYLILSILSNYRKICVTAESTEIPALEKFHLAIHPIYISTSIFK